MRKFVLFALILLLAASGSASAHRGGVHFGVFVGVPYYPLYTPYYYPPVYYPPVVISYPPPVYVERQIPAPPAPPQPQQSSNNYWYYCQSSGAYYPYVRECPAGWQRVPAQPR